MEKLTEQQRVNIGKMSDARLTNKLATAGYNPDDLAKLERPALVSLWAELVASGVEQAVAEATDEYADVIQVQPGAYGEEFRPTTEQRVTLVERWLILEERRLEEQRLQREEQRLQREQEERRLKLKERELELNRTRAEQEERHRDSTVAKLKLWGDALRNTITKMPTEPVDVISWFICLERLFNQLQVPNELRAVLMRPHLSERAKALLPRCDVARSADYDAIKKYLLQEMRLSSSVYLDKFNSVTRDSTETFQQFSLRLLSLFEFYVQSRKVDSSYDKLLELVVYDRINSVLPQFLAKHVLALESAHKDGWLGRQALVEALDAYMASATPDGRARVAAIGNPKTDAQFKQIPQTIESRSGDGIKTQSTGSNGSSRLTPVAAPRVKRCYLCSSPSHIQSACPRRRQNFDGRANFSKNQPQPQPRVNACLRESVEFPVTQAAGVSHDGQLTERSPGQHADEIDDSGTQESKVNKVELTSAEIDLLPLDDVSNTVVKPDSMIVDPLLASGWSHLHYVNVEIEGLSDKVVALDDSGAQLCCVRADVIASLALPKIGHTTLRGITSDTVMADLVSLSIKMSGANTFVPVTCAVCDKLNSPLILGSDVVDRLHTLMLKEHYPLSEAVSDKPCVDCHAADADVCLISDDDVVDEESVDDIKALMMISLMIMLIPMINVRVLLRH